MKRWQAFVKWCRSKQGLGINNARQLNRKVLAYYAAYLRDAVESGDLAISTAQVKQIVDALCRHNQLRAAAIVLLARATGMRLREAILANLQWLSREAKDLGKINIQDGTKGGRAGASAPRWIAVDGHVQSALGLAQRVSPGGSRNLIAPDESYLNVLQEIIRPAQGILHAHNLKGFHELRAAYACERYEQITQHRAPINEGEYCQIDWSLDREARRQISYELGHGRIDVVAAHIGGRI